MRAPAPALCTGRAGRRTPRTHHGGALRAELARGLERGRALALHDGQVEVVRQAAEAVRLGRAAARAAATAAARRHGRLDGRQARQDQRERRVERSHHAR
jgi:hypothetical protein